MTSHRTTRRARIVVVAVSALLLIPMVGVSPALATSGVWSLTESTTLKADYQGNIVIRTDNVTLDCAGHTVSGPGVDLYSGGIDVRADNVTVKRCVVSGFEHNGLFGGGADLRVERSTFARNGNHGVHVDAASNGAVAGVTSRSNGAIGIVLTNASGFLVDASTAQGNPWGGVALFEGTTGTTVSGSTAIGNGIGFILVDVSDNTLRQNTANSNAHGFTLLGATDNTLVANTANGNEFLGFQVGEGSNFNKLSRNTANGNDSGISVCGSDGNTATSNTANGNTTFGVVVFSGSSDNTFRLNTARSNGYFDAWDEESLNIWEGNSFGSTYPLP